MAEAIRANTLADLMTVEQAAEFLHLSVSTVRSYIRERKLIALRVAGMRMIRVRRSEVEKLLEPIQEPVN